MSLGAGHQRLGAVVHQLDGLPGLEGQECQHNLDADVLATTKRAPCRHLDHTDLLLWQAQRMSDLAAVLVRPLGAHPDGHFAVFIHPRHASFGLEVGVIDEWGVVHPLHDGIGLGKASLHIPPAQLGLVQQIAAALLVHQGCTMGQCLQRIADDWQEIVLHIDQRACCFGGFSRAGGNHRHGVAHIAHLGPGLGQDRLVRLDQPKGVGAFDVVAVENSYYVREGAGALQVHALDARMRVWAAQYRSVQGFLDLQVAGVQRPAQHLVPGVDALRPSTNHAVLAHKAPPFRISSPAISTAVMILE